MCLKKIIFSSIKTYIFFLLTVLFLNFSTINVKSSTFKVDDIEISEPFEVNFKKKNVIDKAFKAAFEQLTKMTVVSSQSHKIKDTKISDIKNLIESFNIKNEKFVKDSYQANFEVNFNKQNTLLFLEKKNIFPSIPKKKKIIIIPILIDTDLRNIYLFDQNPFLKEWLSNRKIYHLLNYILPTEDLDVVRTINDNFENLEDYNFNNIVKKYDSEEYIVSLIYKERNNFKVFSKIKINNDIKILSQTYKGIDISIQDNLHDLIDKLKGSYEDIWKLTNQINRSVKLPINITVKSTAYEKNIKFNNFLETTELVSSFFIKDFDHKKINYRIIFNGSPKNFLDIIEKKNINIDTSKQVWKIE